MKLHNTPALNVPALTQPSPAHILFPAMLEMTISVTLPSVYAISVFLMLCTLKTRYGMDRGVAPPAPAAPSTPLRGLPKSSPPPPLTMWR